VSSFSEFLKSFKACFRFHCRWT